MIKDKWYEVTLIVDPIDGQIKFDKVEINQALANYLALEHINASDGAVFEESIESLCIFRTICGHISRNSGAIITIDYGYNIDPKIISHPANCQLMRHQDNMKKNKNNSIDIKDLMDDISKWNTKYTINLL